MLDPYDLRVTSYLPQTGHGHGGMTVGLTTSGIIVHHIPTGLGISCDSERSQHANKEKALAMLESLVIAIEAEKHFSDKVDCYIPSPPVQRTMANKVNMIKEVREKVGCGLKEAKEAVDEVIGYSVDYEDVILKATLYAMERVTYKPKQEGYCIMGDNCLCTDIHQDVRAGCFEWRSQ